MERVVILARGGPLRFQLQEPAANSPKETVVVPATQEEWQYWCWCDKDLRREMHLSVASEFRRDEPPIKLGTRLD
jgi:hypothetical protein